MELTKYSFLILYLLASWSCTEQRDLYVASYPHLQLVNDWVPSQISDTEGATAMIYDRPNSSPTELMTDANRKTIQLDKGFYDILVLNGLMYSPKETHLDYIFYQGTDRFETFEAVVTEMDPAKHFRAADGEIIVNNPDILATRSTAGTEIEGRKKFEMKYQDGKNGFPTHPTYIEDTIPFSPCRVTHTCQVIARVRNAESARVVQAKLHGLAGSVFLANRLPAHNSITHQFKLNSLKQDPLDPTVGTISSPVFTTFGPPLDLPTRRYTIDVNVLLINSEELPKMRFDVTDQVEKAIAYLSAERLKNRPIMETFYIYLDFELPIVISDGMDVGVGDWGDDVIVTVPINL